MSAENIKNVVKEKYGEAAKRAASGGGSSCSGSVASRAERMRSDWRIFTARLRLRWCRTGVRPSPCEIRGRNCARAKSSGFGSRRHLTILSARRVGPGGKAYGLDMTDEMLALAEENKRKSGLTNVEFLRGEIENIPLPENSVDVIVSNCVINLSAERTRVARLRLKPARDCGMTSWCASPRDISRSIELWVGCVAGALREDEYIEKLAGAGFDEIANWPSRIYRGSCAGISEPRWDSCGCDWARAGKFLSAFIRAKKPAARLGRG